MLSQVGIYKFFDLPYLMNRIKLIAGDKVANRMSPWNLINREEIVVRGRPQTVYQLYGIVMLDYLDLYKWFIPTRQESYRLDFIGELELGRGKDDILMIHLKIFTPKIFKNL